MRVRSDSLAAKGARSKAEALLDSLRTRKKWRTGVRHRVEDELVRPRLLLEEESEG